MLYSIILHYKYLQIMLAPTEGVWKQTNINKITIVLIIPVNLKYVCICIGKHTI